MTRKRTTGSRFQLGEPWDSDLTDFCAAHYDASATQIIRKALQAMIEAELSTDESLRKRFEESRKLRMGLGNAEVRVLIPKGKD